MHPRLPALLVVLLAACGSTKRSEERLGETLPAESGGRRVTPILRTGANKADEWVLRFAGRTEAEVVLPSVPPPGEPDRSIASRSPHLFWSPEGDRLVTETIAGGFLVVYFPEEQDPFVCTHRVLRPRDVPLAWNGAPDLDGLVTEMLTDPERPHDAREQAIAFSHLRRVGPASPFGEVLVRAALDASAEVDAEGIADLLEERLRGLAASERRAELAKLAEGLRRDDTPDRFGAAAPRIARALGASGAQDFGGDIAAALARIVRVSRAPTNAPKVVDGALWLAWAAGRLRVESTRDPLRDYLDVPFEVPFKTRVARAVAAWALTRLGDREVLPRVARWNRAADRRLPAVGGEVPKEPELLASPRWAERVSSARVARWVQEEMREGDRPDGGTRERSPEAGAGPSSKVRAARR